MIPKIPSSNISRELTSIAPDLGKPTSFGELPPAGGGIAKYRVKLVISHPGGFSVRGQFSSGGSAPMNLARQTPKGNILVEQAFVSNWKVVKIPRGLPALPITATIPDDIELTFSSGKSSHVYEPIPKSVNGWRPEPQTHALVPGEQYEFVWYVEVGAICAGAYQLELRVAQHGGKIGSTQFERGVSVAGQDSQESPSPGTGRAPSPGIRQEGDEFVFTWPPVQRPCGVHTVYVNIAGLGLNIQPDQFAREIEILHGKLTRVSFNAALLVDAGGGGSPPLPEKPKQEAPEKEPPSEGADYLGEHEAAGLEISPIEPPFADFDDLDDALTTDPSTAAGADLDSASELDVVREESACTAGPPWTLLDLIVDGGDSEDASQALS